MAKNSQQVFNLDNNDSIKSIPKSRNTVIHSRVKGFDHIFHKEPTVSIKYVISGSEAYRINGHTYNVTANEFLIVNKNQVYEGHTDKRIEAEGICVYLHDNIIGDVFQNLAQPMPQLLENPFEKKCSDNIEFFENIYKSSNSILGIVLRKLHRSIQHRSIDTVREDQDLYYAISECLLVDQRKILQQVNSLNSVKTSTKKELYRRVMIAKEYLDEYYYKKLDIGEVSQIAALSEYHFFRTFKQVFKISPHKYLIRRRLKKSTELLRQNCYTITEIAYLIGFPDIHSFSKSFKKEFGITPTQFISQ